MIIRFKRNGRLLYEVDVVLDYIRGRPSRERLIREHISEALECAFEDDVFTKSDIESFRRRLRL